MYLTQDAAVFAGREPFGFPKKIAYIITQEHGGKDDDGYGGFGNDYFNFTLERRGYLIHTATGRYDDAELPAKPTFYGDPRYGRMNLRLITDPSLRTTKWDLTYLPSEVTEATAAAMGRPETEGQHRFQLKPESIRTASANAIRTLGAPGHAVRQPRRDDAGQGAHRPDELQLRPHHPRRRHHLDADDRADGRGHRRPALRHAVPVHDAPPLPEASGRLAHSFG